MPNHIARLSEAAMIRSLLHLRTVITRERQPGLEHVEALLRLRGVDPAEHHVPAKRPPRFKRSEVMTQVRRALREGPKTARELKALLPDVALGVERSLQRMRCNGEAVRDGWVWSLRH